jgi:cadmium resistance protein CadD (predicted permease)
MTLWGVVASAIVMFASTNIDVAIVLVVCFANAADGKDGLMALHVWIGQFIGFSILVVISLVGALAGSLLPPHYSGLLGFVPLFMGIVRTKEWCNKGEDKVSGDLESIEDGQLHDAGNSEVNLAENADKNDLDLEQPSGGGYELAATPVAEKSSKGCRLAKETTTDCGPSFDEGSLNGTWDEDEDSDILAAAEEEDFETMKTLWWRLVCSMHSLKMTAVTLSNGGDNVAVYIAGLATYNAGQILLTLAIFYVLLVAWLYVTKAFVSVRFMASFIGNYGIYVIPVALVCLGVYILWSNDAMSLVCASC